MNTGQTSPGTFHQSEVNGTGLVHGDDFVIATSRKHSKEVEDHLRSTWEVEVQAFGPGRYDQKQIRVLNRIVRWRVAGIEYEADRSTDVGREECDEQASTIQHTGEAVNEDKNELEFITPEEIKSYRGDAAKGNCFVMNMPDLQFSAMKTSRAMLEPTRKGQRRVVRLSKYLEVPRTGWWPCHRVKQNCAS